MKQIIICDIDGTVADCTHRLHHIKKTPKDWDGFHKDCDKDEPLVNTIRVIEELDRIYNIVFITGRMEDNREATIRWLWNHIDIFGGVLLMRPTGNKREDYEVKKELFEEYNKKHGPFEVVMVFEDRQRVVDMWREMGFTVAQIAKGNY